MGQFTHEYHLKAVRRAEEIYNNNFNLRETVEEKIFFLTGQLASNSLTPETNMIHDDCLP